jgi:hypothetical protein
MADWDLLNTQFDTVMSELTDSDWDHWYECKCVNRAMRRKEMELRARIQAGKLQLNDFNGNEIFSHTLDLYSKISIPEGIGAFEFAGESNYAMAA